MSEKKRKSHVADDGRPAKKQATGPNPTLTVTYIAGSSVTSPVVGEYLDPEITDIAKVSQPPHRVLVYPERSTSSRSRSEMEGLTSSCYTPPITQ
jgi:hypothetical protein